MKIPTMSPAADMTWPRQPGRLSAYIQILRSLAGDLHFNRRLTECLGVIREQVKCEHAGIYVQERRRLVLHYADGFARDSIARAAIPGEAAEAVFGAATALARILPASKVPMSAGGDPILPKAKEALTRTLALRGQSIGGLALWSNRTSHFSGPDLEFIDQLAEPIANAVISARALQRIYRDAETDQATGLPNLRAAFRRLESELVRASRRSDSLAVLFIDVDGLKPVNDSYGHSAGDQLLLETSRRLGGRLRSYDQLARVGGDEFLAILVGISGDGIERKIAELKAAVSSSSIEVKPGGWVKPAVSIGGAAYPADGETAEELISVSDRRMYEDKRGRFGLAAPARRP